MKRITALLLLMFSVTQVAVGAVSVEGARMWPAPDNTRVVFDINTVVDYNLQYLSNPDRLVIDLKKTYLPSKLGQPSAKDTLLKGIRTGIRNDNDLRIVLDLHRKASFKSFLLKPNQQYGHRLVIDLFPSRSDRQKVVKKRVEKSTGLHDIVIAIDAGHGGEDPGARGYKGSYEKDSVLAIARKLEALIKKEPGMRPVMIRDGDYFLSLRQRTLKARRSKADLFISIHADAFKDRRVRGTSVYVLSKNGATSEAARWLAEKENASDLVGGVSLDDKDNVLAAVLLDLSQNATLEASYQVGNEVLKKLGRVGKMHKKQVQHAGFVVLKSPDIPSILIETAFISNPEEERNLRSASYQNSMARAILGGIRNYFRKTAPAGTLFAARKHIIARGDTLSEIAQRYQVSVNRLRAENRLSSDVVKIGQVLNIPSGS